MDETVGVGECLTDVFEDGKQLERLTRAHPRTDFDSHALFPLTAYHEELEECH